MLVKLDDFGIMPKKAHKEDAGWDLFAPHDFIVEKDAFIDTGVHIAIPAGYVGLIKSKSGLNAKKNIVCEGVIDAGYTGSICVKMHKLDNKAYRFERGDKITQLVVVPIIDAELELVDTLESTERGAGGFGSSGK